jgi:hypothetical protein
MRASMKLWATALVALPLVAGCAQRTDTATQTSEQEVAGAEQPGDVNPIQAQVMVDDVTLGNKAAADGTIAAEDQNDDFAPGDPIVLSMKVADAPPGTAVKVVWYGPGELKVGEAEETVDAGETYLTFQAEDTGPWQKGDYRAEVWVGDERVAQQQLQIVDASESPA